jgi:Na+/H+-dicarboxylate symporter
MSLATKVLIGLGAGIVTGVFFGELAAPLAIVGQAFILLLQVTVLPFMVVALISGLGRLSVTDALAIARSGGVVLLVLWIVVMAAVLAFPIAFPDWESASFFTRSLVEAGEPVDFLSLYIPANPFASLAGGIVPAIVVFSVALGLALIGIDNKATLLDVLETIRSALDRVTGTVVRLAPIGVFALMASAAGTLDLAALGRIQVYVFVYIGVALALVFWVLPALVRAVTPLRYGELYLPVRDALVTAFATGNLLIILPILVHRGKETLQRAGLDPKASDSAVDVLVPISFTIPNMGKLLSLAFVPFAGWFTGFELSPTQYPVFATVGFVSFFGEPVVSLPFLLNLLRIPSDTFDLFVTIDVITSRFGTLLAAAHTLVLALVAAFVMAGRPALRVRRLAGFVMSSVIVLAVPIVGGRLLFTYAMEPQYTGYREFVQLELRTPPVEVRVLDSPPATASEDRLPGRRLEQIRRRGSLRVGYFADALPLAFRNSAGRVVGFDIEMAHLLARELGVVLDLVRIDQSDAIPHLESGALDIVMSGSAITPLRSSAVRFSTSVLQLTAAFVVPDPQRDRFTSWAQLRRRSGLRLGVGENEYYRRRLEELFPDAEVVTLPSARTYFTEAWQELDALVTAAEVGSAWTLVYPQFAVAVPQPDPMRVPAGYPMPYGEERLHEFVDAFIGLKLSDGTITTLFEHWFEGRGTARERPRWSVVRDVLGWVERGR